MVAGGLDLVAFVCARRRAQRDKRSPTKICSSGRSAPYLRSFVLSETHWALTSFWLHFIIGFGLLFQVWFYALLMAFRFRDAVVLFISDHGGVSIWTMCNLINVTMIAYELSILALIVTTRRRPVRTELIAYAILLVILAIRQVTLLSWPWLTWS